MQLGHTSQQEDLESEALQADLDLLTTRGRNVNRTRFTEEETEHLKALKKIKDALTKFNLSKNEVRVYLFLARFASTGPRPTRSSGDSRNRVWFPVYSNAP